VNYEKFETDVLDYLYECEKLIGLTKGREYTQGDRLDNFKLLAGKLGITPEQVLGVYLMKHIEGLLMPEYTFLYCSDWRKIKD